MSVWGNRWLKEFLLHSGKQDLVRSLKIHKGARLHRQFLLPSGTTRRVLQFDLLLGLTICLSRESVSTKNQRTLKKGRDASYRDKQEGESERKRWVTKDKR